MEEHASSSVYEIGEEEKIQDRHGGDVYSHAGALDFSANINPLGPPEAVVRAVRESAEKISRYPDPEQRELLGALAESEGVPRSLLICGNGAAEILFTLVWAEKPRQALLPVPSFLEYERSLAAGGCRIRFHQMREEDGFCLREDILPELDGETDILFLCNPGNPTGLLIDPDLLREITGACRQKGILMVLDECFLDFAEEREERSLKPFLAENPQIFLLRSFTKFYAMPGLRLGYGICSDKELLGKMKAVQQPWNVSLPAQEAGIAALRGAGQGYADATRRLVGQEREFLKKGLSESGFRVWDSKANYLFFSGPKGLAGKLLQENILIRHCTGVRGLREGYYRIAVRTREENERLLEAVKKIRQSSL